MEDSNFSLDDALEASREGRGDLSPIQRTYGALRSRRVNARVWVDPSPNQRYVPPDHPLTDYDADPQELYDL